MTRTSLETHHCSLARTADIIGDKWALMILRDAFYGVRTFSALQSGLGIAKTVLSDRLRRLIKAGILQKIQTRMGLDRSEYRLTTAGRDLFPVIVALIQWGDRWLFGAGNEPMDILDLETSSPVLKVVVQSRSGHVLAPHEVALRIAAGPEQTRNVT